MMVNGGRSAVLNLSSSLVITTILAQIRYSAVLPQIVGFFSMVNLNTPS